METKVTLDCGVTMDVRYRKYGWLVYVNLFDLSPGSISVPGVSPVREATIRISVLNLPAIKKLVDAALKDPDVKAIIKKMKKSGIH